MKATSGQGGFTLLETVTALSIFMVVMLSASNLLVYATKTSGRISVKHELFENVRIALDVMEAKINSSEAVSLSVDSTGSLKKLTVTIPGVVPDQSFEYQKAPGTKYHRIDFSKNELASYIGDIKVSIDGDLMTVFIRSDDRLSEDAKVTVEPVIITKNISLIGKKIH